MIELLVNKRTGLPIAAKPIGSPWTARELDGPNLCVVTLEDPPAELAARMAARGVVANPFAEYETDPARQPSGHGTPLAGQAPRGLTAAVPGGDAEASPVTRLPRMVRQSTIELHPADVRPGATVAIDNCQLPIGN